MDGLYENDELTFDLVGQTNDSATPALTGGSDEVGYGQVESKESGTPFWITFFVGVGAWFVAAFIIKRFVETICKIFPANSCSEKSFNRAVSKARKEMNASSRNSSSTASVAADTSSVVIFESYDGDFYIKYEDCGKVRSGFMKIQLKKSGSNDGYTITGMCADADGYATITDGHVSYAGNAWWVQEVLGEGEERSGLRVFSRGKFDFSCSTFTFSGSWISNRGTRGSYSKFEGQNVDTAAASASQINIPIAIALPDQTTIPTPQEDSV